VAFFTNIIHRFGVPNSIITDNGTQFTGRKFLDFCEDHHIRVDWAAVAHPMTNGQVERANDMILQGLKPRIYNDLNKFGKRWIKELPSMVWSLRTTPSRATGFTPFFLVYGVEAILPTNLEYAVAEPPELFQLKCLSHASGAVTHLNRNNPSVLQI
jgi:transposase InsO family protein